LTTPKLVSSFYMLNVLNNNITLSSSTRRRVGNLSIQSYFEKYTASYGDFNNPVFACQYITHVEVQSITPEFIEETLHRIASSVREQKLELVMSGYLTRLARVWVGRWMDDSQRYAPPAQYTQVYRDGVRYVVRVLEYIEKTHPDYIPLGDKPDWESDELDEYKAFIAKLSN
jgi:hypothetical protein